MKLKFFKITKMLAILLVFAVCLTFLPFQPAQAQEIEEEMQAQSLNDANTLSLSKNYVIGNLDSGKYLTYKSLFETASVYINERNGGMFKQLWKIVAVDDKNVYIKSATCPQLTLAVSNNSSENGAKIELAKFNDSSAQLWQAVCYEIFPSLNREYFILSQTSGYEKGVDITDYNYSNGANVQLYAVTGNGGENQKWFISEYSHTHNFKKGLCNCGVKLGDVNEDISVDDADVIRLLRYVGNWKGIYINLDLADMNRDGVVNDADATFLSRLVAGWNMW